MTKIKRNNEVGKNFFYKFLFYNIKKFSPVMSRGDFLVFCKRKKFEVNKIALKRFAKKKKKFLKPLKKDFALWPAVYP